MQNSKILVISNKDYFMLMASRKLLDSRTKKVYIKVQSRKIFCNLTIYLFLIVKKKMLYFFANKKCLTHKKAHFQVTIVLIK